METRRYVHLHVHTQYSLLDGAIRIDDLIDRAVQEGMDAVAITDHGTMFGAVEFYEKARKAGVKPIIGCECYVAPRSLRDKTPGDRKGLSHLVLLAENLEGYRNLCRLASIAQLEGFYYKPRIDKTVLKAHRTGLVALSACLQGEIPQRIVEGRLDLADAAARDYLEIFGEGNFFLELQHNGLERQEQVNAALGDMSVRLGIPLVATNDCHYLDKNDARAHDVLLSIQTGKTVNDPGRFKFPTDQLYFKPQEEMIANLGSFPGAIENTVAIAARCQVELDFKTYHFPQFASEAGMPPEALFEREVRDGFARVMEKVRRLNPTANENAYRNRLEHEIGIIKEMGFAGYFLIVADLIRFAKDRGIPVGPGRGSAAGSLVAFSLGITTIDPLAHGLIFERFLNPARSNMPDIDMDFCINGRKAVMDYIVQKYGEQHVAKIITFGNLRARAAIRDVGRALGMALQEVDAIAKMVPEELGITLAEAVSKEPKLRAAAQSRPAVGEMLKICRVLEGISRHASIHAAGMVIGDKPLVEYLPLYKGKGHEVLTQFDGRTVERIGLVKFDILGLRNLSVIQRTLDLIADRGEQPPDLDSLDLADPATYALLCRGETTGVFQLEARGVTDFLVSLRPSSFNDIIALMALYRPGPLESGMVGEFVARKHGEKPVEYMVPELEPVLKETYGVILYQEQVMRIAAEISNYSMARADDLRKAMGKKLQDKMAEHRGAFVVGAVKNNIPEDKAGRLFDLIEKFGGYGFNKSHSAAYALITFQTAYLKAHYPLEFTTALLSFAEADTDKIAKLVNAARSMGIAVLPPDINHSGKTFATDGRHIRYGLLAIKNVGEAAVDSIIAAREAGPFRSLPDLRKRTDGRLVNKRALASLIKSGAFESTGFARDKLFQELAMEGKPQRALPSKPLFDTGDFLQGEYQALGVYLTDHPLRRLLPLIQAMDCVGAMEIAQSHSGKSVRFFGTVADLRDIETKKGKDMCFMTLADQDGSLDAVMFSPNYRLYRRLLNSREPLFFHGTVQDRDGRNQLTAKRVMTVEEATASLTRSLYIRIDQTDFDQNSAQLLVGCLRQNSGTSNVILDLDGDDRPEPRDLVYMADTLRVRVGDGLKAELLEIPAVAEIDLVLG